MAFELKRHRKPNKKSVLLKRLKELESKDELTEAEEKELDKILAALGKKRTNKIENKKLNNQKQNKESVFKSKTQDINININVNGGDNKKDLDWSTPDHYKSASGTYRKARIDNRKY
tara:strand:+ start:275 stop:625 length:351 start_codon:yes stop_codon:yes gene_type:complete